jgi:hypothetical protein
LRTQRSCAGAATVQKFGLLDDAVQQPFLYLRQKHEYEMEKLAFPPLAPSVLISRQSCSSIAQMVVPGDRGLFSTIM